MDLMYSVGNEVRYNKTGQFGIVVEADEEDLMYTIKIGDQLYDVTEDDLS